MPIKTFFSLLLLALLTLPSTLALAQSIEALEQQLNQLNKEAVWERRKLVKQIDDLRIETITAGVVNYTKLSYQSTDGLSIPVYLFKPLNAQSIRIPAVIYAHGGQHGRFRSRSLKNIIKLVQQGYIVLAPDYRSSSGYSQEFYEAADYGGMEINDMLAARDYLENFPEVDPNRIAIMGLSHGGYNALMALARAPGKFAGAVDFFGPTDLVWRLTATPDENPNTAPGDQQVFARMVGKSITEAPELYRARSPRYLAKNIDDPLLILHGDKDNIVLLQESQWLAEALNDAGKTNFSFHVLVGGHHGYPEAVMDEGWQLAFDFLAQVFNTETGSSKEKH